MSKIQREKPQINRESGSITRTRTLLGRSAPDFGSLFEEDEGSPLAGIEYPGDIQGDANAEISEILRQIIDRKKAQAERFRITDDPEYFICICFQSRDQKADFLQKVGWIDQGDKYINGLEVARRMGVKLEVIPLEPPKLRGRVKNYERKEVL